MTMSDSNFENKRSPKNSEIVVGNNSRLNIKSVGDIKMAISENQNATVQNVLHIPDICANLMSVSQIAKNDCTLTFDKFSCKIYNANRDLIATAPLVDELHISFESFNGQCTNSIFGGKQTDMASAFRSFV